MESKISEGRRALLGNFGKAFLAMVGGMFSVSSRESKAGVFAGQFMKDSRPIQIQPGYYDEQSQLYFDAKTDKPMFVAQATEPVKKLSDQELADILKNGKFIEMKDIKVQSAGGWYTPSRQRTLTTTQCCPIVTDAESDVGPDDTGNPP